MTPTQMVQLHRKHLQSFLDPEGGSQNATLIVVVVVVEISSLRVQKSLMLSFLIHSGAQQNFAYTFMLTLPTDLLSQIFHVFSN